jgi:hypothetical protein
MAQVDPNRVIQKLALRIANDAIQLAMTQVAADDAAEQHGNAPAADDVVTEGV